MLRSRENGILLDVDLDGPQVVLCFRRDHPLNQPHWQPDLRPDKDTVR